MDDKRSELASLIQAELCQRKSPAEFLGAPLVLEEKAVDSLLEDLKEDLGRTFETQFLIRSLELLGHEVEYVVRPRMSAHKAEVIRRHDARESEATSDDGLDVATIVARKDEPRRPLRMILLDNEHDSAMRKAAAINVANLVISTICAVMLAFILASLWR